MGINLFLNLDDDLHDEVWRTARIHGRTAEEEVRKRLMESWGEVWTPLTANDIINDDRVNIMLDLRTT